MKNIYLRLNGKARSWLICLTIMFLFSGTLQAQYTFNSLVQTFSSGVASTATQCSDFNTYRASLTRTDYKILRIRNNLAVSLQCTNPTIVQSIASLLRTSPTVPSATASWTDGANVWYLGACGSGIDLGVNSSTGACQCPVNTTAAVVRPCILN